MRCERQLLFGGDERIKNKSTTRPAAYFASRSLSSRHISIEKAEAAAERKKLCSDEYVESTLHATSLVISRPTISISLKKRRRRRRRILIMFRRVERTNAVLYAGMQEAK